MQRVTPWSRNRLSGPAESHELHDTGCSSAGEEMPSIRNVTSRHCAALAQPCGYAVAGHQLCVLFSLGSQQIYVFP